MSKWTNEEEEYLRDNWGCKSVSCIAHKLNRTEGSVINKGQKLGLRAQVTQSDYITLNQLMNALGYKGSYSWWTSKYLKYGLPISYREFKVKKQRIVLIDDFWDWAEKHKNIVNFARFEKNSLGQEPAWVDAKRKRDISNPSRRAHNRCWTRAEDSLLESKLKLFRYSYAELAEEFNRTECAIKRRIYDLNIPYRPVGRDNHIKWTVAENTKMMELYYQGYDNYHIAKLLGKTELSISDRIKNNIREK